MNKRKSFTYCFAISGLVLLAAGIVLNDAANLVVLGITALALTLRYRRGAAATQFIGFLLLAGGLAAWDKTSEYQLPPWLVGALPFILSYVFDYVDERVSGSHDTKSAPAS